MKIVFIKDHPVGIKKGLEVFESPKWCKRMISEGYAEEVKEKSKKEEKKGPNKTKELK